MSRHCFVFRFGTVLTLLLVFMLAPVGNLSAANIKSFIESVRRAPVVYVGVVREVTQVGRDKFAITARATIEIVTVARGADTPAHTASFPYLSYDEKTPMMDGPPQYVLQPGTWVLVFADTLDSTPRYLRQGDRAEVARVIAQLSEALDAMTSDKLAFNEITEADRTAQRALYRRLIQSLPASE